MKIQDYIETELRRLDEEMIQAEIDENWQLCERAIGAKAALINLRLKIESDSISSNHNTYTIDDNNPEINPDKIAFNAKRLLQRLKEKQNEKSNKTIRF